MRETIVLDRHKAVSHLLHLDLLIAHVSECNYFCSA